MDFGTLYQQYKDLKSDSLCFAYLGEFSDDMTEKILNLSEYNIDNIGKLSKMKKRISFLMAESFQNIVRHKEEFQSSERGMFLVRNIGRSYYISSCNLIENKNVKSLKESLIQLNKLEKDELKKLYMEILENSELTHKGGAGLGLIEMARRSGEKLEFDFQPAGDDLSLFYLQIKMKGKKSPDDEEEEGEEHLIEDLPITEAIDFRKNLSEQDIIMSFKGDFSQISILSVLKMVENNLGDVQNFSVNKRLYLALVEILQNISNHSKSQEGIFVMGQGEDGYFIHAGNLIDNKDIPPLQDQLNHINNLEKDELISLYQDTLKKGELAEDTNTAGLGLMDIARDSKNDLEFIFTPFKKDISFYSLQVTI